MANIPFALYLLTSDSSGPSHRVKTGTDEGWVCWGRCHCGTQTAVPEGGSEGACGGPTTMVSHHCKQPDVQRGAED